MNVLYKYGLKILFNILNIFNLSFFNAHAVWMRLTHELYKSTLEAHTTR
jgi:hypothetical protein